MPNQILHQRLQGIQNMLMAVHQSSAGISTSSKGREREEFIDKFVRSFLPNTNRCGNGDITDAKGHRSGQLEAVIEYPFSASFPLFDPNGVRVYLAEAVACVIEVKSNLINQWDEVVSTAAQLSHLTRRYNGAVSFGRSGAADLSVIDNYTDKIPLFAVGYTGWKTTETAKAKLIQNVIDGILVIDPGIFVATNRFGVEARGCWSLFALAMCIQEATVPLLTARADLAAYGV